MELLAGQTVLLTGASGGLGTFMAYAFVESGLKQALVAHPGVDLAELQADIEKRGGEAIAIMSDLRDPAQRRQLLHDIRRRLGPVDFWLNNAGVEFTSAYHNLSEENIWEVLAVNLEAPMFLCRPVLPEMPDTDLQSIGH